MSQNGDMKDDVAHCGEFIFNFIILYIYFFESNNIKKFIKVSNLRRESNKRTFH